MYSIEISKSPKQFLEKLDQKDREIILKKIYDLRENPFRFLKRLQGEKLWRMRVGSYRVIVDVVMSGNKIIVLRIGHRKNVYE